MTYSGLLQPSQPLAQVTNSKPFLSFRIDAIQSNDQPLTSTLLPYTVTISTTPLLAQYPNLSLGSLHVFAWDDNQWKAVSLCQSCRSASTSSTLKFQTNLLTEFVVVGEVANHKIYLPLIRK